MPFLNEMINAQNTGRNDDAVAEDQVTIAPGAAKPAQKGSPLPGSFDSGSFAARLGRRIIGQDKAIESVTRAVNIASIGATDSFRPLANILLVGPTGVGKTELVRQVASVLRSGPDDLCRVDMNALAQEHYAASLSGAPPGYAGSKENFSLFDRSKIEGDPYTPGIVLFDEVEKAHPTVIRTLLQIMDNGILRLASGQETISFRNCYLFMTSNLGSTEVARRRSGRRRAIAGAVQNRLPVLGPTVAPLIAGESDEELFQASVKDFFDVELLNRIDETVTFSGLDEETARRITLIELGILEARMRRKSIEIIVDDGVVPHLVQRGFDPVFGARSLRRVIRTEVSAAVASCILDARLRSRQPSRVHVRRTAAGISAVAHP